MRAEVRLKRRVRGTRDGLGPLVVRPGGLRSLRRRVIRLLPLARGAVAEAVGGAATATERQRAAVVGVVAVDLPKEQTLDQRFDPSRPRRRRRGPGVIASRPR